MSELPSIHIPAGLPQADPLAKAHSARVQDMLAARIRTAGGWLPFEQWMQAALHEPGLGYYSAGSTKFSHGGDFTTAPETSPLFGQAIARQVLQVLQACHADAVLEFGAGTGSLAASLIPALQSYGIKAKYFILELSADLRARQQENLEPWAEQVQWLDSLPAGFTGCAIANEVLDAMPATLFQWNSAGMLETLGVTLADHPEPAAFRWQAHPAPADLAAIMQNRMPPLPSYRSELNLQAEAWIRNTGNWLHKGALILIDYGFPQAEYYHPQRAQGTLMCHFRHHAHDQPLILPGLQDITAHVDFTAMADAALEAGLDVLGYTSQARFLMNTGIMDMLLPPDADPGMRARQLSALNILLSEAEMGELFKVLAIGRGMETPLLGFMQGDRRHRL